MPKLTAGLCHGQQLHSVIICQGPALDLPVADERQASSWADSPPNRNCMADCVLNLLLIDLVLLPAVPCNVGGSADHTILIAGSACLHSFSLR